MNKDSSEVGALWAREGKTFLSGKITLDGKETPIIVFVNQHRKEGSRQPTHLIHLLTPKDGGESK